MSDEELCKALRSALWGQGHHINIKAADRIEQLERERDGYLAERNNFEFYLQRTHADLELEAAAVDALAAKLAKAVEELRDAEVCLRQSARGDATINDMETWADDARTTLAELEGK